MIRDEPPGIGRYDLRMKTKTWAAAAVLAATTLTAGCGSEPSTSDRVIAACKAAAEKKAMGTWGSSRLSAISLHYTDLAASLTDDSKPTERWTVEGQLLIKKTIAPKPYEFDDDGKPAVEDDPGRFICKAGHRKSDGEIVVFEIEQKHPTGDGSVGAVLAYPEGESPN